MLDLLHLTVADHHVGAAREDRRPRASGSRAAGYWWSASVLTITSAPSFSEASMPGLEGGRQPLVVGQPDDVVDSVGPGHLDRPIGGAVVDDQPFDRSRSPPAGGAAPRAPGAGWPPRRGTGSGSRASPRGHGSHAPGRTGAGAPLKGGASPTTRLWKRCPAAGSAHAWWPSRSLSRLRGAGEPMAARARTPRPPTGRAPEASIGPTSAVSPSAPSTSPRRPILRSRTPGCSSPTS